MAGTKGNRYLCGAEIGKGAIKNQPKFFCPVCGAEADFIDTEAGYSSENPFFCAKRAKDRDQYLLLPVINFPRMGVCGYAGEYDHDAFSSLPFGDERP